MKKRVKAVVLAMALIVGMLSNVCVAEAKVKLNNKSLTLTVGSVATLKVTGTNKKVSWSSNKKLVASVTPKGKVKARKPGKATITAKVGNKKYKCKIVVVKKKKAAEQNNTSTEQSSTEQQNNNTEQNSTEQQNNNTEQNSNNTEQQILQDKTSQSEVSETDKEVTTEKKTEEGTTTGEGTTTEEEATTEEGTGGNTPSQGTLGVDAGEYSIALVHEGEGTYYDPASPGAANLDDFAEGYYTAAMNTYDYMNGLAGAYVEITDKDGDKINVLITDRLPEGKKGDIDLTHTAFNQIEPEVTGRMNITWRIIPFPTDDPIQYVFKPTSGQYWAEVQIRNHRYPIKKVEYLDESTNTYKEMERMEYNYFRSLSGLGSAGPYTFRVTDIYGHQLVDTGIVTNDTKTPVNGADNFPY